MQNRPKGWPWKRAVALPVLRQIGELDAVIGEHGVDEIWNCLDKCFKECGSRSLIGSF
jgi:hypothetical protein